MVALARKGLLHVNKRNEWYTPTKYVEAARFVMHGIDLDPASCEFANKTVKADDYYTQEDNGLLHPWHGNVWLNPPYGYTEGKSNIQQFTQKLLNEYESGNVLQAILLSTLRVNTSWFAPLWQFPICFVNHNILFNLPKHEQTAKYPHVSHMHGSIFVYLGVNEQKFTDVFSDFGAVIPGNVAVRGKRAIPLTLWEVQ